MSVSQFRGTMMVIFGTALVLGISSAAHADMKQVKTYKEAFPDATVKCIGCHTDAMPKKDGPHDVNDYGKAVMAEAQKAAPQTAEADLKPTAADYQKAGKVEDFKK